ncbi:hypothetical protein B0H10DRAFT_1962736 [Mycena sp. CBHHK59/15]|nr:hypothetical protein B0H10DRAFT_1962736 [Mycena sp. CBHHK59/15]
MYPQMDQQAGWDPADAGHTGHASVTFLRVISESEETESFVLAPAIISGPRCLETVSPDPGRRSRRRKENSEARRAGIPQAKMVYKACGLSHISLIPSRKPALDYWSRCNLATCADFMYPGSGGFSPAVQNLSNGALDYWIECNLASCIEFMYPGSAGLIATPVEPNPSSAALDYCRNVKGNFQKSHKEVLRIWVTNEYLPDLYLVLFEAQNNLAPPRSALQMNNPPTRTLIQQLKLTSWQDGPEDRGCIDWVSRAWQTATSLGSGDLRSWFGNLRLLFGFWGLEVVARQAATFVWVLGLEVVAWQASTSVWASRGLRLWPGTLRLLFGFWGLEVVVWQTATSVWVLGT